MALDMYSGRAKQQALMDDYQKRLDAAKEKDKLIQQERTLKMHQEIQREMFKMASEGMGRLTYANGQLKYEHGKDAKMSKVDLWNHFTEYANKKNIQLDQETFNGLYEQYKAEQNDLWLESFRFAEASGAKAKDFHKLFRSNERYAKDFMDVESTGFAPDDPNKLEFSQYKPSGQYMRHGDSWMGAGPISEWVGENPWTTAGIGAGVAGAGYMARNPIGRVLKGGYGMIGPGGLAAIGVPAALGMMGAPQGLQTAAGVASSGYFLGKAGETVFRNQVNKAASHLTKPQMIDLAKKLGVDDKALKGSKAVVEKALGDKVRSSSALNIGKAVKTTKGKAEKTIGSKLLSWTGRAGSNIGKGSRGGKIGAGVMAAYSIYDLATTLLGEDEQPMRAEGLGSEEIQSLAEALRNQGLPTE